MLHFSRFYCDGRQFIKSSISQWKIDCPQYKKYNINMEPTTALYFVNVYLYYFH